MTSLIFETYAGLEGLALVQAMLRDFPGRAAVVSSFGAESAVLLHMVAKADPSTPIIFLDTGKHFWETLSYRSRLIDQLGLTGVRTISPEMQQVRREDPSNDLYARSPDRCCQIRKVFPLQNAIAEFDVLISGRKRYHGAARATLQFLSMVEDRLRVDPLAGFSALDIEAYMKTHGLLPHPLTAIGYLSVGCEPCTHPGGSASDPRAGRWSGLGKTECGIHLTANNTTDETRSALHH